MADQTGNQAPAPKRARRSYLGWSNLLGFIISAAVGVIGGFTGYARLRLSVGAV